MVNGVLIYLIFVRLNRKVTVLFLKVVLSLVVLEN